MEEGDERAGVKMAPAWRGMGKVERREIASQ